MRVKKTIKLTKYQKERHILLKINPFDILAEQALREAKEGKTTPLEEVIRKLDLGE